MHVALIEVSPPGNLLAIMGWLDRVWLNNRLGACKRLSAAVGLSGQARVRLALGDFTVTRLAWVGAARWAIVSHWLGITMAPPDLAGLGGPRLGPGHHAAG